jgi:ATP-dependent RNA helicase DeaD
MAPRISDSQPGFDSLGLSPSLLAAVSALGYEEPTPVQREAIPLILSSRDVLAQAATGTGKTAAFALPMIQRLVGEQEAGRSKGKKRPRGLVLVPTRELAMQVAEAIHKYARGTGLTVLPLYGGASMQQQIRVLERGVDIIVATPGRALDHLRRKTLALDDIRLLVLDEGDEMLDMGFAEDIDAILEATPEARQTTLFSATVPARILAIADRHLTKPARLTIAHEKTAAGKLPRVRQIAYIVRRAQKPEALGRVLDMENPTSAIVFCRTRIEVDSLVDTLKAHGFRAEALHGGMQQRQRDAVMNRFRAAKLDLLVATDVAARGLDIEHLSHVVNYDLPAAPESYIHRIGRTGRAGRAGTAITLAEPREHRLLRSIEQMTKQKIEVATVPSVADLRARRLELTSAAIREHLVAGNLDDTRGVVATLAEEFDLIDVAAAAVKVAHAAAAGDSREDEDDVPAYVERAASPKPDPVGRLRASSPRPPSDRPDRTRPTSDRADRPRPTSDRPDRVRPTSDRPPASERHHRQSRDARQVRLHIGAGRRAGIRPADLVGAITGEAGVPSRALGAIEIADRFSLIDVPEDMADHIIAAMSKTMLRGHRVTIRRDRD